MDVAEAEAVVVDKGVAEAISAAILPFDDRGMITLSRREPGLRSAATSAASASTFPACGARWTQAEGGEVWCEDGRSHPRKEVRFVGGKRRVRCACFPDPAFSDARQLYPGCANAATRCKTG